MKKGTGRSDGPGVDSEILISELKKAARAILETKGLCSVEWVYRADIDQWEVLVDPGQQEAEEKSQADIEPVKLTPLEKFGKYGLPR